MTDLIGITASAAGGGLFGVIGTALGRVAGYYERRQSFQHEERRWQHESKLLDMQRRAAGEESDAALAREELKGRWAGLHASLTAEAALSPSYKWVDAVRALTRPMLTLLLWTITTAIWFSADMAGRTNITETAAFAATAATLWWFGDRSAGSLTMK